MKALAQGHSEAPFFHPSLGWSQAWWAQHSSERSDHRRSSDPRRLSSDPRSYHIPPDSCSKQVVSFTFLKGGKCGLENTESHNQWFLRHSIKMLKNGITLKASKIIPCVYWYNIVVFKLDSQCARDSRNQSSLFSYHTLIVDRTLYPRI